MSVDFNFLNQFCHKFAMEERYAQKCDRYFLRMMRCGDIDQNIFRDSPGWILRFNGEEFKATWHNDSYAKFMEHDLNEKFIVSFRVCNNLKYAIIQHDRTGIE